MDILQSEKPIFIIASKIRMHPKYNRSMRIKRILKLILSVNPTATAPLGHPYIASIPDSPVRTRHVVTLSSAIFDEISQT